MAELWDLYDSSRKKTGVAVERGQTIPEGSYHLVVSVCIPNTMGKAYRGGVVKVKTLPCCS